jgi:hypothetical protein
MTTYSAPNRTDRENSQEISLPSSNRSAAYVDESPELLRWRAELLLDEMMLGAVDASAAGPGPQAHSTATGEVIHQSMEPEVSPVSNYRPSSDSSLSDTYLERIDGPTSSAAGGVSPEERVSYSSLPSSAGRNDMNRSPRDPIESPDGRSRRLAAAEQRYEQLEQANRPPTTPYALPKSGRADSAIGDQGGYGPVTQGENAARPSRGEAALGNGEPGVRRSPAPFASVMAMASNGAKRSTLLPRMSTLNIQTIKQEIADLQNEINGVLPIGHEISERARHLLDKAYTIIQSDPVRSAEVEYYMQQVRSIVRGLRQTHRWSNLYRSRLRVYLTAWSLLSLIVLFSRYLYQEAMDAFVASVYDLPLDSFVLQNFAPFLGAMCAGALGSALGAMFNIQRHGSLEHRFFDRKYGLRGLILPLIGILFSISIYLLFVLVFYLANINPSTSLIVGSAPAAVTLIFGLVQESIYGTRD